MVFLVNVHLFPGRAEINVRKRKKREKSRKIEKRERNGQQFCKLIVNNEERRPTFEKTTQFFFSAANMFGQHLSRSYTSGSTWLCIPVSAVSLFAVNYTLNTRQGKVFHLPREFRLFENTFTSAVSGKRDPHPFRFVHSFGSWRTRVYLCVVGAIGLSFIFMAGVWPLLFPPVVHVISICLFSLRYITYID